MRKPIRRVISMLALPVLALLVTPAAEAQTTRLEEMASLVVLPVIAGHFGGNPLLDTFGSRVHADGEDNGDPSLHGEVATLATITNATAQPLRLVVDVISGDNGFHFTGEADSDVDSEHAHQNDRWRSTSFTCDLTAGETTTFVFAPGNGDDVVEPAIGGSREDSALFVECSDLLENDTAGKPKALFTDARNGVMVIAVADPETGKVISNDALLGDAVIVDYDDERVYSFGAIGFQAGAGQNDGDKIYRFDGQEYARFPSVLATNFLAPADENEDGEQDVRAELILFTLDGTVGSTEPPRARLGGFGYNDDEQFFDFQYEFDCFDVVSLDDLNPNFEFRPDTPGLGLGSMSGHLRLVSQPTATGNDAHDDQHGDGNDTRRRGVHGWIAQANLGSHVIVSEDHPIPGTPKIDTADDDAWGRPLSQSLTALVPFGTDEVVLDADVRN